MQDYSKLSTEDLLILREQLQFNVSKYHNFQLVRKIQLNSAYGAVGNEFFRFYNTALAEAVTLSGQLIIQYVGVEVNNFLNNAAGTNGVDYVIYSDTDSVYVNMEAIVDKFCKNKPTNEIIDYIDRVSNKFILPHIHKSLNSLSRTMNAYESKISMEREVIADKGIFTAKKRYMLNVWDSEGIRYTEPKPKIMGSETNRSSTPEIVRNKLKDAIKIILNKDEESLISFVDAFRDEFKRLPVESIAFPRSVNGLSKYKDRDQIYKKGTPIAVKGALLYNYYVDKMKLGKKYNKIFEGEKIKFIMLKKPNPLAGYKGEDCVIAFPNKMPIEFAIEQYIDYNTQFEKTFLDPLKIILETINWDCEEKNTLEDFFV